MIYPGLFDNVSAIFFPDQTLYDDDDWGQDIGQFSTFSNKSSIWIAELRPDRKMSAWSVYWEKQMTFESNNIES